VALRLDALSRNTLVGIYVAALTLIAIGIGLWLTGHGTGDPYLSIGIVLAAVPPVVIWLRRRFGRV
jgi:hypothetical protein